MGTDLGTVNKRLNQIIALLGSHANLSEVAKNTYIPVVAVQQTMNRRPGTPNEIPSMGGDTADTGQAVLSGTNWAAELQTANSGLDYTYEIAFPHLLYAAAEVDNSVDDLHPFRREFPTTNAEWDYTDISTMQYSPMRQALRQSAVMVHWGDISPFPSLPVITEPLTVNTDPEIDKNTILSGLPERFDIVARREDNWDERGSKKPRELALANAQQIVTEILYTVIDASLPLRTPFTSSDEDGNVTVVWYKREHELHLEITDDEVEYVRVWGFNIDTEMDAGTLSKGKYLPLWKWLLNG